MQANSTLQTVPLSSKQGVPTQTQPKQLQKAESGTWCLTNFVKGVSDEKLIAAERGMLAYTGLPEEEFEFSDVIIDEQGNYVRTIQVGHKQPSPTGVAKPKVVIIHGYGASGLFFYRVMKHLVDAGLHLIFIDIIGMGASGRPEFNEEMSVTEADQFFVDFLEKWRIAFGDLTGFYLAGHSFGGYISGQYALQYHQHIKKLLLLSPAGVMKKPDDFDASRLRRRGMLFKLVTRAWEKKWSPFGLMRKSGSWIGRSLIKSYLNRRMNIAIVNEEERNLLLDYMQQIFMREGSTEYAIFICFQLGLYAHHPLEDPTRLGNEDFPIPITFYYGDRDWMDYRAGQRVVERSKFYNKDAPETGLSQVFIIPDSDHHLYMDNPRGFAELLIFDVQLSEKGLTVSGDDTQRGAGSLVNEAQRDAAVI
ncbi:hypothetical protein FGO68_gene16455 [Halteria grandinella]|uniref:AB hydrolase-1 domain-containing protein n=1 Tax=Halteria grandinella TaxID=5974 RepID=A0A8J8NRU4_HALGN|nr:hypothetical protein FGO68_gene16455 [Halteria grandinella]